MIISLFLIKSRLFIMKKKQLQLTRKKTPENLKLMKEDAIIMHPLPRRNEIHPEVDLDPRAMYWRQLRNGLYLRAALMLYIFRINHRLKEY